MRDYCFHRIVTFLSDLSAKGVNSFTTKDALEYFRENGLEHLLNGSDKLAAMGEILNSPDLDLTSDTDDTNKIKAYRVPTRITYRFPGSKTSSDDLVTWSAKKLRDQVIAQVRSDFGGQDPIDFIIREANKRGLKWSIADAEYAFLLAKNVGTGSRERIKTKVDELQKRAELLVYIKKLFSDYEKIEDMNTSADNSVIKMMSPLKWNRATHIQSVPAIIWHFNHNLDSYPVVTLIDGEGNLIRGDIKYPSKSSITITFGTPVAGQAILV